MLPKKVMLVVESLDQISDVESVLAGTPYLLDQAMAFSDDWFSVLQEEIPGVVVFSIRKPGDAFFQQVRKINQQVSIPVVVFSESDDVESTVRAVKAGASAYVVDGLQAHRLKPILDIAILRFQEFQSLREELQDAKSKLQARKIIDKAKGMLMAKRKMTEEEAYSSLRKMAMDKAQTLEQVCKQVIEVLELIG